MIYSGLEQHFYKKHVLSLLVNCKNNLYNANRHYTSLRNDLKKAVNHLQSYKKERDKFDTLITQYEMAIRQSTTDQHRKKLDFDETEIKQSIRQLKLLTGKINKISLRPESEYRIAKSAYAQAKADFDFVNKWLASFE